VNRACSCHRRRIARCAAAIVPFQVLDHVPSLDSPRGEGMMDRNVQRYVVVFMRISLVVVTVALAVLASAARAQVRSTIIGPGATRYPIAVSPLRVEGADAQLGARFADRVVRNLELSGLFRVVPRATYISRPQSSGVTVDTVRFENWSVLGAHALVKGMLTKTGDDILIEARLFDVARRSQLSGRRYHGRAADLDRTADRFADEILAKLSGERGPFDSKIAFLSTRGGRFKDVYVMSANGEEVRRLTRTETLNLAPRWSPRGDSLMVTSYRGGGPDLYTVSYPGGEWRPFARLEGLNLSGGWSPDGSSVVATLDYAGNSEIGLLDSAGAVAARLTKHFGIDVSPTWSPDGRQIAFCSSRAGGPQIYVMNRNGSGVRRLTRQGSYNTSPSWSPKGDRVAFVSRIRGSFQVFIVNVDGSGLHQVTTKGNNEDPTWSPDGRYLVYSGNARGRRHLFLSDTSGIHTVQLTDGEGDDTSPNWSGWLD
jgi:TolB protein